MTTTIKFPRAKKRFSLDGVKNNGEREKVGFNGLT
jgi:hypothetical protein